MTRRRSLSPKERAAMLAEQEDRCKQCAAPIGPQPDGSKVPFIAEHTLPVALGNGAKPDCLLCVPCAGIKTNGTAATTYGSDKHEIAKAKRLQVASILQGWRQGETVRQTASRLGISSYRVREVRYRHQPQKVISSRALSARKPAENGQKQVISSRPFPPKPPGYQTRWPSRAMESRPFQKREARRG